MKASHRQSILLLECEMATQNTIFQAKAFTKDRLESTRQTVLESLERLMEAPTLASGVLTDPTELVVKQQPMELFTKVGL